MHFYILTLFPEAVLSMLKDSILKRAEEKNILSIEAVQIRDFSKDKHRHVDDYPYGGGNGMIFTIDPVKSAFEWVCEKEGSRPHFIYMSPCGKTFTQEKAKELKNNYSSVAILCGHYEGIDERIIESLIDEEISLGDFVLTGGEIPAAAVVDAVARLVPGVLSEDGSYENESHYSGLLEYPQYTRPPEFEGMKVPEVLLSGNHAKIEEYNRGMSLLKTKERRPDLFERLELSDKDRKLLKKAEENDF